MAVTKPVRVVRTYRQRLVAPPAVVFPLLCPVRESEWAPGWQASSVWSDSGFAEPDCAFTTRDGTDEAIWTITRHEPERLLVEMVKVTPGVTVCRITVQLAPAAEGSTAEVTYRHTSLGPRGDRFVADFTEARWEAMMRAWEDGMNRVLARR